MSDDQTGRRVLILENEQFISDLYARSLHKKGYTVDIEADGLVGLKAAQTDQYDVILLDLMMPNMTGIEVLKTLRDESQTPHLKAKIIVATNLEEREEVRDDLEKHADGYVIKAEMTPNEITDLVDSLG